MIEIPLTQGKFVVIDDEDVLKVIVHRWYASKEGDVWYAKANAVSPDGSKTCIRMHRLITGVSEPLVLVDHFNGDGLNNRRNNLRICDHAQNLWNRGRQANNTSGYKGVSFCKITGRWVARIRVRGKYFNVGRYDTPELASEAYQEASLRFHGQFAYSLRA